MRILIGRASPAMWSGFAPSRKCLFPAARQLPLFRQKPSPALACPLTLSSRDRKPYSQGCLLHHRALLESSYWRRFSDQGPLCLHGHVARYCSGPLVRSEKPLSLGHDPSGSLRPVNESDRRSPSALEIPALAIRWLESNQVYPRLPVAVP